MPTKSTTRFQRLFAAATSGILITTLGCGAPPADPASGPQSGLPPVAYVPDYSLADSLSGWYALGIGAHHLCSGLWVVGRDYQRTPEQVVQDDISRFTFFRWESGFTWSVDEAAREATVSSDKYGSRTAEYNGDQGCSILPAGNDGVFFQPRELTSTLPDARTQDWPTGDREAFADFTSEAFSHVDQAALDRAFEFAFDDASRNTAQNTRGLIAIYNGKIIAERYQDGWGPNTPQISWSMGKSIVSALTGTLIQQGYFGLEDSAPVPAWQRAAHDPRKDIRVKDLLRMSGGLDFDNLGLNAEVSYTTANEHMRIYFDALNVDLHAINQPLRYEPGTVWRYRNSDPLSLMHIARQAVAGSNEDFLAFPQRQLFDRIGMRSMVMETDAWGNFIASGYDYGSTRDWARFGLLHLWDGVWEGERILPEGWAEFVSTPAPGDPSNGYGGLFWLNRSGAADRIPTDAYWASGFMGQQTIVIPSKDMVIVRHGPSPGGSGPYINDVVGRVLDAIPPDG